MSDEDWNEGYAAASESYYAELRETELAVETQQEKVAALRGYAGKLRSQIAMARDILQRHEHRDPRPSYPVEALHVLSRALEIEAP